MVLSVYVKVCMPSKAAKKSVQHFEIKIRHPKEDLKHQLCPQCQAPTFSSSSLALALQSEPLRFKYMSSAPPPSTITTASFLSL